MKKRKDGRYRASIVVGRDENGNQKRKSVYGYSKSDVNLKISELRVLHSKGVNLDKDDITLGEYSRKWFKLYKNLNEDDVEKYQTYKMYEKSIEIHIIPDLGYMIVKDVRKHHIQEKINEKRNRGLTRTVEIYIMVLKQIFKQALEDEFTFKNPMATIKNSKSDSAPKRPLTLNEINLIDKADLNLKEKAFLYTLLYTGLRPGEILALTKNDYVNNEIQINKVVVFKPNKPEIKNIPKSVSGIRNIPIDNHLKKLFKTYFDQTNTISLFTSEEGITMSKSAFRKFWGKIINKLNIAAGGKGKIKAISKDIVPYIFRHTFATMLYYSNCDMKKAQYYMGHKSINITLEIYTHLEKTGNHSDLPRLTFFKPKSKGVKRGSK